MRYTHTYSDDASLLNLINTYQSWFHFSMLLLKKTAFQLEIAIIQEQLVIVIQN